MKRFIDAAILAVLSFLIGVAVLGWFCWIAALYLFAGCCWVLAFVIKTLRRAFDGAAALCQ